ncbi:MAG: GGDEF domain-containing protein [Elusimicrobiota bacterium]
MSQFRALTMFESLLRNFQNQLNQSSENIESMFQGGMGYLSDRLNLSSVSIFWWVPQKKTMVMQYILHEGALYEGEEEIIIGQNSLLAPLVFERKPVVISSKRPWVAFIPLQSGAELIGALQIERPHALASGKILGHLPSFYGKRRNGARDFPLLEDIGEIISTKLIQLHKEDKNKKRAQFLKAGSEVASAVFERPRLREMLESVAESIVRRLNFDRVRFYLVDSERSEVKGYAGMQIPDRFLDLEQETYVLRSGINSLVDAILSNASGFNAHVVGGRVAYIPLIVNGQVVGCLAVDNLLSQQMIDDDQIESLRSLAVQVGMAILNARLFEDIERQAITDGLTKLYVYRYFQERLKEEMDRADRYSYNLALVMMDVDSFKQINDTHGHLLGDRVLEFLAQTIKVNTRRIDLAARYAGDEFVMLLPEITEQEAWLMAERLTSALKKTALPTSSGQSIHVSVTLGISMYTSDARTGRDLIEAADRALYWAKKNQKGSICFYRNIAHQFEKTA